MLNISFYICDTLGFLRVMYLVRLILRIISLAVPLILVVMTVKDLFQNVINPNEKEGLSKIYKRVFAGVIVFFIPTLISLVFTMIDFVFNNKEETDYKASNCYQNANRACISKVEKHLNCEDVKEEKEANGEEMTKDELNACISYRRCNGYALTDSCGLSVVIDEKNCSKDIEETNDIYNVQGS